MQPIVEVVMFVIRADADPTGFLAAAEAASAFLRRQEGFIRRELLRGNGDRQWIDLVWWRSRQDALAAASAFRGAAECQAFVGLIATDGLRMMHLEQAVVTVSETMALAT